MGSDLPCCLRAGIRSLSLSLALFLNPWMNRACAKSRGVKQRERARPSLSLCLSHLNLEGNTGLKAGRHSRAEDWNKKTETRVDKRKKTKTKKQKMPSAQQMPDATIEGGKQHVDARTPHLEGQGGNEEQGKDLHLFLFWSALLLALWLSLCLCLLLARKGGRGQEQERKKARGG